MFFLCLLFFGFFINQKNAQLNYYQRPFILNTIRSIPKQVIGSGHNYSTLVFGIPSNKRLINSKTVDYLPTTLNNLIQSMTLHEQKKVQLLISLTDEDLNWINVTLLNLQTQFATEIQNGLLQIIYPTERFYGDLLEITQGGFGDSLKRVHWRSKQNLDYAFLMAYASSMASYYVQLEDDILTNPGFITDILKFTYQQKNWFMIDFSEIGFIGKLFPCSELSWLIQFFVNFYQDMPVDCLFDSILKMRAGLKNNQRLAYKKKTLFRHIGKHSTLENKIQFVTNFNK